MPWSDGREQHDEERDVEVQHPGARPQLGDREGGEHDRGATPQAGPAEHQPLAHIELRPQREEHGGRRPRDGGGHDGDRGALGDDVHELSREHEQPESQEQAELGDPGEALVEGHDRAAGRRRHGAEHEPGQVDRQEAGAVQRERGAEGQHRRGHRGHRVQAGGGKRDAAQEEHRNGGDGESHHEADRELAHDQQQRVLETVAVALDRLDAADDEQDRDRVVDARLALQRAGEPAAQGRAAQDGEDRGGVGGGHRRAEQQRLERVEVEQQRRRDGGQHGRAQRPQRGEGDRRPEHRPDLAEAGRQAALEEDEGERDHAGRTRQLEVVLDVAPEIDQAEAVRPDEHADAQHQDEARHAEASGGQRGGQTGSQHDPDDQDELTLVQARNPARRRSVRCPG